MCEPDTPITDEEASAMARAALKLFRRWGLTDGEAEKLLGLGPAGLKAFAPARRIPEETAHRLAHLIGIHASLRAIFRDPAQGYAWVKAPNEAFGGRAALEVMIEGGLAGLDIVRRLLLEQLDVVGRSSSAP